MFRKIKEKDLLKDLLKDKLSSSRESGTVSPQRSRRGSGKGNVKAATPSSEDGDLPRVPSGMRDVPRSQMESRVQPLLSRSRVLCDEERFSRRSVTLGAGELEDGAEFEGSSPCGSTTHGGDAETPSPGAGDDDAYGLALQVDEKKRQEGGRSPPVQSATDKGNNVAEKVEVEDVECKADDDVEEKGVVVVEAGAAHDGYGSAMLQELQEQNLLLTTRVAEGEAEREILRGKLAAAAAREREIEKVKAALQGEVRNLKKENEDLKEGLAVAAGKAGGELESLSLQLKELLEDRRRLVQVHESEKADLHAQVDALLHEKDMLEEQLHAELREKESLDERLASVSLRAASAANGSLRVANERRELVKESEELKRELAAAKAEIGFLIDMKAALESEDFSQFAMRKWSAGMCGAGFV